MKKCTLTKEQLNQHVHKLNDLEVRESAIQSEALQGIKDILRHCENNKHHFPITDDEDEDIIICVFNSLEDVEATTVTSIELTDKEEVIVSAINGDNYHLWETNKPNTFFYNNLISDVEFDMIAES